MKDMKNEKKKVKVKCVIGSDDKLALSIDLENSVEVIQIFHTGIHW